MTVQDTKRPLGTAVVIALLWGMLATVVLHDDLPIPASGSVTDAGAASLQDEPATARTAPGCLGCLLFSTGHATLQSTTSPPCLESAHRGPGRSNQTPRHLPLFRPLSRGPPLA